MMFLRFTRLLLLLLTGVVSVTSQCMHADDGCTKCEVDWDGFNFVCPDFCGPGNTLSYIRYGTSHVSYVAQGILNGVPITVFNDRGGFPEDSDCMDQDTFLAFLNTKDVDIGYFSMDGPRPGTWSCQEVCPTAAIENENNTDVVSIVENENKTDVVSTSQVSDTPTTSAARAKASTIGCLFLFVVLNSLLTNL